MDRMDLVNNRTRTKRTAWVVTQVARAAGYAHMVKYEQMVDFDNDRLYWRRTSKNRVVRDTKLELWLGEAYNAPIYGGGWDHLKDWPWGQDIVDY
jgi:hypothetical protein